MPRVSSRPSSQHIVLGDCLDVFRDVHGLGAIVSDPPAGISFMSKKWDHDRGGRAAWIAYWAERFAVARDACEENAVALIWALPRTSHWTACAVEDAGWRIRDVITHHFGQGWPKDKNALKPSTEMWILAVKGKPTLGIDACRVERGGESTARPQVTSGLGYMGSTPVRRTNGGHAAGSWPTNLVLSHFASDNGSFCCRPCRTRKVRGSAPHGIPSAGAIGRHESTTRNAGGRPMGTVTYSADGTETVPAYLCAVGCDCGRSWLAESGGAAPRCECGLAAWWACPIAEMDRQGAERGVHSAGSKREACTSGERTGIFALRNNSARHGDVEQGSSASRFFPRFGYHAKAPANEKHAGCENLFWRSDKKDPFGFVRVTREEHDALDPKHRAEGNVHPTPKRLALMRWLHALTGAKRIGDLCGGSGSGAVAAYLDGVDWIGAEVCPQAIEIAEARLAFWRSLSPKQIAEFTDGKSLAAIRRRDGLL